MLRRYNTKYSKWHLELIEGHIHAKQIWWMTMSSVHYIAMETSLSCLSINKEETAPSHRMQNWLKSHREPLKDSLLINAHKNICWYNIAMRVKLGLQSFVWSNKTSIIWSVCHSVQIEAIRPRWFWSFGGCLSTPLMWNVIQESFPASPELVKEMLSH